ncbi:phosphatases II [Aspergillus ellipticus CBS 707.79]|uniref:protein-tyrosine-phosphatase n=1 Tax=Aspergillus ellipticus CBS 707.79 TaxID=1448320 RepID=A0A319DVC2_9EURO|nr:phosphatases II [Aspergillus ellipticus CBS 707.79]
MSGNTGYGQVIEYIQDRLYLASYDNPPDARTPFPYPVDQPRSPSKRSARAQPSTPSSKKQRSPVYFTVDDVLLYNSFHADFGPLHIGHLYRFAVHFHEILGDSGNSDRAVVFYSKTDARSRANAACLVACYMVLIQSWPPHLALAPIAQADPPYMPFRDAGYSQADFILNIQDVVYGVWKAKEQSLCGLRDFSLEDYEKFERVDMGDFNWITPHFLAFASPQHSPIAPIPTNTPEFAALPSTVSEVLASKLPLPFKNVLAHFSSRNVGLVVRLNSELYSPSYFTAMGITHVDMIFEDGTCPPLPLVRRFIKMAHEMITVKKRGIAVHCKAGLGRTGCLIGAYLIYRYGFTANEIIAFMRFMRPGMVVGPQQHWLHLNQGSFREWWFEDSMKEKLAQMQATPITPGRPSTRTRANGPVATPPNNGHSKRAALGEIDHNECGGAQSEENLPAPTPGQPRKSHRKDSRHHPYSRTTSGTLVVDKDSSKNGEHTSHRHHRLSNESSESEEEIQLRMLAKRSSKSPVASPNQRSVSYSATVTASYTLNDDDRENWGDTAAYTVPKTPGSTKTGSGAIAVTKVRTSPRRVTDSRSDTKGVRKASGRVGSAGSPTRVK